MKADHDAMDVDAARPQTENKLGGTSGGVSLGLSCSSHTKYRDITPWPSSAHGMGVEMGIDRWQWARWAGGGSAGHRYLGPWVSAGEVTTAAVRWRGRAH